MPEMMRLDVVARRQSCRRNAIQTQRTAGMFTQHCSHGIAYFVSALMNSDVIVIKPNHSDLWSEK